MMVLCLAALTGRADEQKKITLSNDNTKETVNLSYCNIFVTLMNPDSDDEFGQVLIEIENLDEQKILALFHKPYKEKEVKKLIPHSSMTSFSAARRASVSSTPTTLRRVRTCSSSLQISTSWLPSTPLPARRWP